MDPNKKDFLIAEFIAISEHFRSYQNNRLNIVLLSVPAIGAIMLHCYEREHLVRGISVFLLYVLLALLITLDEVFMKRLRNYTQRLSKIEEEFEIVGYATQRITDVKNNHRDATTKAFRVILHLLNITIFLYAVLAYVKMRDVLFIKLPFKILTNDLMIPTILAAISLGYYFVTMKQLDTKGLPGKIEKMNSTDATPEPVINEEPAKMN